MITPSVPRWASARPARLDSETDRKRLDRIMDAYRTLDDKVKARSCRVVGEVDEWRDPIGGVGTC